MAIVHGPVRGVSGGMVFAEMVNVHDKVAGLTGRYMTKVNALLLLGQENGSTLYAMRYGPN